MVPKRWAKRAVTRNAIKRQIYSVSSQVVFDVPGAAHVVRLRSGFDRKQFVSASSDQLKMLVRQELLRLFASIKPARGVMPRGMAQTAP
jgi:ribonuclease P protein component